MCARVFSAVALSGVASRVLVTRCGSFALQGGPEHGQNVQGKGLSLVRLAHRVLKCTSYNVNKGLPTVTTLATKYLLGDCSRCTSISTAECLAMSYARASPACTAECLILTQQGR